MTTLVTLRGGTRDGETTEVDDDVRRLLAASAAPGLVDVYEETEETVQVPGNPTPARVFDFAGEEPADGMNPELLHHPLT